MYPCHARPCVYGRCREGFGARDSRFEGRIKARIKGTAARIISKQKGSIPHIGWIIYLSCVFVIPQQDPDRQLNFEVQGKNLACGLSSGDSENSIAVRAERARRLEWTVDPRDTGMCCVSGGK